MRAQRVMIVLLAVSAGTSAVARAQDATDPELRGTVVSAATGTEVAGAWIALEGYGWGTYSWNDGHFFLPEIPGSPMRYEVNAVGYDREVLTLDPSDRDLLVELTPQPEVLEGLPSFLEQLQRRRNRSGDLRVFDREALAFHNYFDLRDFLAQHRVRGVRRVCVDERPEAIGILERQGHEFYMAEVVGGYLRLYTDAFVERAARERLELRREPRICSGPLSSETD